MKGSEIPYTGKIFGLYRNGQKLSEGNVKDGKHHGLWTQWHENGQKQREANYKDGKKDGLQMWWHENGRRRANVTSRTASRMGFG